MKGRDQMDSPEPRLRLIEGGLHVDSRGIVAHVNTFDFKGVDRFYTIRAHRSHEPRGWVGHRRDHKWFTVIQGTVLLAVVRPDHWDIPTCNLPVERFVLSAAKPQVLHVPAGHATGSMSLTDDAILMIFSSGRIEDAKTDDYRFAVDTWPVAKEA
jgi:dTDP-4-dehydrorhamnose 3,5-epimerase-like enzyme